MVHTVSALVAQCRRMIQLKVSKKPPSVTTYRRLAKRFLSYWPFFVSFLAVLFGFFWFLILKDLPTPTKLIQYNIPLSTKMYDRNGKLLYEIFSDQNRTLVTLDQIPQQLQQATIAIEDKEFYKHFGINPTGGMLRAIKNMITKQRLEGGSTITQQMIKTALLTPDRTVERKVKEVILALWAELIYSKEQILELYFNQVPYGGTAWGVNTAAKKYFGKDVSELDLAESTLLAGLPQAPTRYSPFGANPELAKNRQRQVLNRMVEDKYITREEADTAFAEALHFASPQENIKAPHFVLYVKELLVEKYGQREVEQGGMKVTTTLDLSLQEFAEGSVASEVAKLQKYHVTNGAAVITRPPTGEILAMVGSIDYFKEGWGNVNVTIRHRQPGSSIKPINYAIGLENHVITASSVFNDVPTCFRSVGQPLYCPKNYDGNFHGPVQTRFALANSYNIPAVKMLALNSVPTMVASASAFGLDTIQDPSRYGLSLTLGGGEVTMLDMAEGFSVFANAGKRKDLVAILKVEDKNGQVLEQFDDPNFVENISEPLTYPSHILLTGEPVISSETAYLISHILLDNGARAAAFGPNSALKIAKHEAVSVKTGTTDDLRDNWTIGYTPNFLVTTWVGNNDNSEMSRIASGVTGAAPIWNNIMTRVLESQEDLWPQQPAGIVGRTVCTTSGRLHSDETPCEGDTRFEYFKEDSLPTYATPLRQQIPIDKTTGGVAGKDQTENVELQEHPVIIDAMGDFFCLDCTVATSSPMIK